jgi:hypothetical protein
MPRQARMDAPGALHHVIVRGIDRRKIFEGISGVKSCIVNIPDCIFILIAHHSFAVAPNYSQFKI